MAKDPAFLFYPSDFMTGTSLMSYEQKGKYITLLCLQQQTGHLKQKDILKICGTHDEDIMSKFKTDENGLLFNQRLDNEVKKRALYVESRRSNRLNRHTSKTYDTHMENENENINIISVLVIPNNNSGEILKIWREWIEYKKTQHKFKYKSVKYEQIAINKLWDLSKQNESRLKQIVEHTIANGWQGFVEPKTYIETSKKSMVF